MNRKICILISVLMAAITFTASAAADFWVLGSFQSERAASNEAVRLKNRSGLDVRVAQYAVKGRALNRLIVEKDGSRNQEGLIADLGIKAWSLRDAGQEVAISSTPRPEKPRINRQRRQEPARTAKVSVAPEVVYKTADVTPPDASASYMDYCIDQANAKERELFCSDGMLKRVLVSSASD